MPTLDVTTGRPMACACATTRPRIGGSIAGTTTVSAGASAAGMSRQCPISRMTVCTPFGLCFVHHGLRVFAMTATFASEHEHETTHTAVDHYACDIGENKLTIPRGDAPGNQQDPRRVRNSPRLAQASTGAASSAAGSNAAMSMLRGMIVRRSARMLWRAMTGAAAKFEGVITQSPRARAAAQ